LVADEVFLPGAGADEVFLPGAGADEVFLPGAAVDWIGFLFFAAEIFSAREQLYTAKIRANKYLEFI
jgi:hypothetical protein